MKVILFFPNAYAFGTFSPIKAVLEQGFILTFGNIQPKTSC